MVIAITRKTRSGETVSLEQNPADDAEEMGIGQT